jgi:release factor glutamine methyltransferase
VSAADDGTATIATATRRLRRALAEAGIEAAEIEARWLVGAAVGCDTTALLVHRDRPIGAEATARLDSWLGRRLAGEPVERLTGTAFFFGLPFVLTPATLVPRPDTETLVVATLERLAADRRRAPRIADLGVGSGAILVALLHELPEAIGVGVDLSAAAVATARHNAEANGVGERALMVCGSFCDPLAAARFDAIVSNPPYIATDEIASLDREVRLHDPRAALDGGADGLDAYRRLVAAAVERLVPDGRLLVEIGWRQAEAVVGSFEAAGFTGVEVLRDLAGRDRVVAGVRPRVG